MTFTQIQITNLGLHFPHKECFGNFSYQITHGSRIAIIGRNGNGKSMLLKIIAGIYEPSDGTVERAEGLKIALVPQIIDNYENLSGGQRLNMALTEALAMDPDVLLLDEPTNHLDVRNRRSLIRMLQSYSGTLIIVSHDTELLRSCINTLWHVDASKVHVFNGNYDDYMREIKAKRTLIERQIAQLNRQKKETHVKLMHEQERAAKRKEYGEKKYDGDKLALRSAQGRGENTTSRRKSEIRNEKEDLLDKLGELRLPEVIIPKFSITTNENTGRVLVSISNGSVGYSSDLISKMNLTVRGADKIAITGDNGSGKSTIIKAILGDPLVKTSGDWHIVTRADIGYLDQHYKTLDPEKSVLATIVDLVPTWSHAEVRRHLNDFLFRKNGEVEAKTSTLSGGERARLSLAQIAAKTPKLLILDEVTNNLDLDTRDHALQVLRAYPGAIIAISHDQDFLSELGITTYYEVRDFGFLLISKI